MRAAPAIGLLGDTPSRDYSRKLELFGACAEPELRASIERLGLTPGMRVLDAGCGTGVALPWLLEKVAPSGAVVGLELASAHVAAARRRAASGIEVLQGDIREPPLAPMSVDAVWCVNTANHLRDPAAGIARLARLLKPGGVLALGQSSLLPDLYFAWDARLERLVHEAVRRHYRRRYGLTERELAGVRALLGWARAAGLREVQAHSVLIERITPLRPVDESYLLEVILRGTLAGRIQPYLTERDFARLARLCDPLDADYALRRPDFHFLQTFTLVIGRR